MSDHREKIKKPGVATRATRPRNGRATLADVARHAGVSAMTVSRALREPGRVAKPSLDKVLEAVEALDYIPDPHAQALASRHTNVIGVIIPSLSNYVFSDLITGLYDAFNDTPYQIQIGTSRYSLEEEERLIRLFLAQKPAGLVITGRDQSDASASMLREAHIPIVQVMELSDDPYDMIVGLDHGKAAYALTEHLYNQGCRKIGALAARMDPRTTRRLEGFRQFLSKQGIDPTPYIIEDETASSVNLGRTMSAKLLARHPDLDGLFCLNDDLALGALFTARDKGLEIPGDLKLSGFNDMELMASSWPALTSVTTPRYKMGEQAAKLIQTRLAGEVVENPVLDLGFQLALRESTRSSGIIQRLR